MSIRQRFRLFFYVIAIVAVLIAAKMAIHLFGLEFLRLDALYPSIVASAVFVIGFLLSSILPDYKEAERMPGEIRMALEGIYDDVTIFDETKPGIDIERFRRILTSIVVELEKGLGVESGHTNLEAAAAQVDQLSPIFGKLERLGMSQNFVVRLRGEQDILRRCIYRISYVQRMQFVPSVHVLIQTLVFAALFLLLFLKTEGSYTSVVIFGFVSYLFLYAMNLITVLEQPFRKGEHTVDDVSFFLLRDFVDKINRKTAAPT
ncbi:MAG: hypothetical protein HY243_10920 [Proteobacteria bacterium]|nr:hypothetical protein [Pseudomonadota bacterium]